MIAQARDFLSQYVSMLDEQFSETGSFGTVRQMDQIYHATQMLGTLDETTGCAESALTRARIDAIARSTAADYAVSVFLDPPPETRSDFDTLVLALRSVVSAASNLETGIALREVELRSADDHLETIRGIFAEVIGPVSGSGGAIVVDPAVLDELQVRTGQMLREVEVEEAAFAAALGGVSAEEYAQIRAATVRQAQEFINHGALHIDMIGILLPTDPQRPFWRLAEQVQSDDLARQAREDLRQIRDDWAAHGQATGLCGIPGAGDRVWYCR